MNNNIPTSIIQKIYEAAVFPNQWEEALEKIRSHFGWRVTNLVEVDPRSGTANWSLAAMDVDPKSIPEYNSYYWQLDPMLAYKDKILQLARPVRLHELHSTHELVASEYFNDHMWANSHSSLDTVCANFVAAPLKIDGIVDMSFSAAEPGCEGMSDEGFGSFSAITKFVAHACGVTRKLADQQLLSHIDAPTSAYSSVAAAVLDRQGRAVVWNQKFGTLVERKDVLSLRHDGSISFFHLGRNANAAEKVKSVCVDNAHRTPSVASFQVATPTENLNVSCIPYPNDAASNALTYGRLEPVCVLLISEENALGRGLNFDLLRQRYALTKKEAELAVALASGKSLRSLATEGIAAYETLRKRTASVLEKTACSSQSELVSLVASDPTLTVIGHQNESAQ